MSQTAKVQISALSAVTIMPVPKSSKGAAFSIIWKVRIHGQQKPMQHSIGSMQHPKRVAFHGPGAAESAVVSFGFGTAFCGMAPSVAMVMIYKLSELIAYKKNT